MNVYDGDTITVAPFGDESCPLFIRLYGIDAPDRKQDSGNEARLWLAKTIPDKSPVEIITMGVDSYGRIYGLVAKNGKVINGEIVRNGHAFVVKERCQAMVCRQWTQDQNKAKDEAKGIWQKKNGLAPLQLDKENKALEMIPGGIDAFGLDSDTLKKTPFHPQSPQKKDSPPNWIPLN
ncbi:MAG: thermonuclease family protein [Desulfovibrio sp.]|nr:thermonuclease family protein [Desulfovibrio sp.]